MSTKKSKFREARHRAAIEIPVIRQCALQFIQQCHRILAASTPNVSQQQRQAIDSPSVIESLPTPLSCAGPFHLRYSPPWAVPYQTSVLVDHLETLRLVDALQCADGLHGVDVPHGYLAARVRHRDDVVRVLLRPVDTGDREGQVCSLKMLLKYLKLARFQILDARFIGR